MAFKDEFYQMLLEDFKTSVPASDSYIYQFIEEEKRKRAETKTDDYSRLLEISQKIDCNANGNECLVGILEILATNPKVKIDKEYQEILLSYGKTLGDDNVFQGIRKNSDRYRKLITLLKEATNCEMVQLKFVQQLCEMVKDKLILIDVGTYFYDVGYPLSKALKPSRKRDRTINLIDGFLLEKHLSLHSSNSSNRMENPEYLKQCEELYQIMRRSKNRDAVIPLVIDEQTASGLYIVGKNYYENKAVIGNNLGKKYRDNTCIYGIIGFRDRPAEMLSLDLNIDADLYGNESFGFEEDIQEAIKWLKAGENNGTGELYGGFIDCNGLPPEDCPEIFLRYFESEELELDFVCSEEEREATRHSFSEMEQNL